uniref:Vacuolar ATPase assembly integral membrane protein VMA21 n=1 Tax=Astatotilapia calliptera TaxID=8154 RepID=A0AAX7VTP2_ASTCA
ILLRASLSSLLSLFKLNVFFGSLLSVKLVTTKANWSRKCHSLRLREERFDQKRRNESSLVSALKTLLFFTILMVTVPIGLYFASKAYIFEGSMKMSSSDSYFYAAIVAVLAVHVVLALFVYVAWNEGAPKGKGKHD